jgi:galactokinase
VTHFDAIFGKSAEIRQRAPGRVNLIGEHTDYNGGFVLPAPIPRWTRVELSPRSDETVQVASASRPTSRPFECYHLGSEEPAGDWLDYIQGVSLLLRQAGFPIRGFDAFVTTDLPLGGGLASSASLIVATLRGLRAAFRLELDDFALALLAHRVEYDFVGARVGVMDPIASSLGREGHALFLDTRELSYRQVPLPDELELIVVDSGIEHHHATGEYNHRRMECEEASRMLGVHQLRELDLGDLPRIAELPEPLAQRARHVVTENGRVRDAVAALEAGRLDRLGELLDASHRSLRNDFQVSTPELDLLVEALRWQDGVWGTRLTGGGFGGAVMAAARRGTGLAAARHGVAVYVEATGRRPQILLPALQPEGLAPEARPSGGQGNEP